MSAAETPRRPGSISRELLTTILALVIALVWAITAGAAVVTQSYTGLGVVTPLMISIAGFLFVARDE